MGILANFRAGLPGRDLPMGSPPAWKPVTLRAPVLSVLVLISVGFISVLEILSRKAAIDGSGGGIAFAENAEKLSTATKFSWVDLDAKRLEPWFQLSKREGASGEDSLLLQYPFDFLPFIPITAFRSKHWNVFYSGTVVLIVFWIITPLQSAIFNAGTVTRSRVVTMQNAAEMMPLETHQNILNSNFLNIAYGISSLGQNPPPFTTTEFALLPFQTPTEETELQSDTQTYSTQATIYSTSLECDPARITRVSSGTYAQYIFDNGRGCNNTFSFSLLATESVLLLYLGYFNDAVADWSIANPNCTREHANNFLAIRAPKLNGTNLVDYDNMTALFCRPEYHAQEASVTVNASDGRVASQKLIGSSKQMPTPNPIFNTTHFEYVLSTGVPPLRQRANLPDTFRLEPYPSVAKYNLSWPMPNAVGFGVNLNEGTIQDLKDPKVLQKTFEKVHKLLFAVAFSLVMKPLDPSAAQAPHTGIVQDSLGAIVMERTISIIVEAAFGVVIIMSLLLWIHSHRRPSGLLKDPATISEVMALIQDVKVADDVATIASSTFKIRATDSGNRRLECLSAGPAQDRIFSVDTKDPNLGMPVKEGEVQAPTVLQPLELRIAFGILFMTVIFVALGVVIFVDLYSARQNGIALPSTNSTVMSIIENYIPTIFATLLEPTWIILNRILCLLKPFDELRKGDAKPSTSLKANYLSVPPQLTVWRAIRSGHFILAAVCVIAVSINLLAVALSGLVEERSTTVSFPMMSKQTLVPEFKGNSLIQGISNAIYLDHFYAAQSNITSGTSLPPWIDSDRFYIPFNFDSPRIETAGGIPLGLQGILGSTTGIGAEISCYELSADQNSADSFIFAPSNRSNYATFTTSHKYPNGTRAECKLIGNDPRRLNEILTGNLTSGASALEIMSQGAQEDGSLCSRTIIAGWVRLSAADSTGAAKSVFGNRNVTQRFMACTPQLKVATFDILVSTEGRILHSKRTSNFTPAAEVVKYFPNATRQDTLFAQVAANTFNLGIEGMKWHNDSFTSDWMNSLIMYKMGNDSIVNPASAVPSYETGSNLVAEMYALVFALLLGLNQHNFESAPEDVPLGITLLATEQRIFLQPIMFKMTVVLLALQLVVALIYYARRPKRFLTRMPTNIASIMAFVSHSRALEDFAPAPRGERRTQVEKRRVEEQRYGYGRFIGRDGKTHVGIERMRYVVPLESENPEVAKGNWWSGLSSGLRRRRKEGEVKVWI